MSDVRRDMLVAENAALRTTLLQLSWRLGKIDRLMAPREVLLGVLFNDGYGGYESFDTLIETALFGDSKSSPVALPEPKECKTCFPFNGRILENHDGRAGYRKCEDCDGTGIAAEPEPCCPHGEPCCHMCAKCKDSPGAYR